MDFTLGAVAEAFRREVQDFLDERLTDELRLAVHRRQDGHDWGFYRALGEKGWILASWPEELGGAGLDATRFMVLWEELRIAAAPVTVAHATMHPADALRRFGHQDLRDHVLPDVAAGRALICLGYTEPESGSDAAAAKTRARQDGTRWIIDGQKMFTTGAHLATHVFLLTRTDASVGKHAGLTTFLVPLDSDGIEIHAVHTMGDERTNIVYFDGVEVDDFYRVGDINGGWSVVRGALQSEHAGSGYYGARVRLLEAALAWARAAVDQQGRSLIEGEGVRSRLARVAVHNEVVKLMQRRSAAVRDGGGTAAVEGPMTKLFSAESLIHDAADLVDMMGPDGLVNDPDLGPIARMSSPEFMFRYAPGTSIYGGTSEIMRGLIAERGLGLPKSR